jgi:phenylpropionate dioxygenase-like ring-hydroxylating dioxygenase large terminal subunit
LTTVENRRSISDEDLGPPKDWFLSDSWHERDLEAIFRPRWLLAGHVSELAQSHRNRYPYITYRLGSEEVLIRRDEGGEIRAFHNFCRHRGSQLCVDSSGTMGKRIVCPYHGWSYSASDGALLAAPHMHQDFDRSPWGLRRVHVDVWFGLIFVCLSSERPTAVGDYLSEPSSTGVDFAGTMRSGGGDRRNFGGYDFARMKLAAIKLVDVKANWKIVVENNLECYHCTLNHPQLVEVFDWKSVASDDFDGVVAARANGQEVCVAQLPSPHTLHGERVCAVPAPRTDDETEPDHYFLGWEPGAALTLFRDYAWVFCPKPISPNRTELRLYWFVANDAEEARDYDVGRLTEYWDITMDQDRLICEGVQRGMEMPAYEPGPLNRVHQAGQAGFYAWYREEVRKRLAVA